MSQNLKICFYRGIQASEEMRTSSFQDQKQILSGTPYALEEQSHRTLYKQGNKGQTLKEFKHCLVKFDTEKMNFEAI